LSHKQAVNKKQMAVLMTSSFFSPIEVMLGKYAYHAVPVISDGRASDLESKC